MIPADSETIAGAYRAYISDAAFPCVAAKAALQRDQVQIYVAGHMSCPQDDEKILQFLYDFVDRYRTVDSFFSTAAVIFSMPVGGEDGFEAALWQRLQVLSDLDAKHHPYDPRVSADPESPRFSFSLKSEAFFVVGLHPDSPRQARRFHYPTLVFNPHDQFETLRAQGVRYTKMKDVIRKRDTEANGDFNPMLDDFGGSSEVYQYSGKQYDPDWRCPLVIRHSSSDVGRPHHYSAPKRHVLPVSEGAKPHGGGCPWRAGGGPDLLQSARP